MNEERSESFGANGRDAGCHSSTVDTESISVDAAELFAERLHSFELPKSNSLNVGHLGVHYSLCRNPSRTPGFVRVKSAITLFFF
jgi:hypothetical protein